VRLILFFLLISYFATAQKECDFGFEVKNDSIDYKETKKHLIYERIFGKKTNYVFVSLVNDGGYLMLNFQKVQKSDHFIETECFDKDTRIFLQLNNGRVYTLLHVNRDVCSTKISDIDNKNGNVRVLNTSFFFMEDDYQELKKFPVALLQIRFATGEKSTYVMEQELVSKNLNITSSPDRIFMDYYPCIE